jgi:DNA-binding response OmpR family regulator
MTNDVVARSEDHLAQVLIVEDEAGIATMLALTLELEGYTSHVAPTGRAALEYLCPGGVVPDARRAPDSAPVPSLLLLDLGLADMDGVALVDHLKKLGCRLPPIIVLSARGHSYVADAANSMGAVDYFVKPADLDDLMSSIAKVLS